ncbi:MAG TPA: hypothetical protein PLE61_15420 [Vicinamibacterales bacterium]|nr:hypothetical protein [Vicinamibacterales bacterium]
MHRCPQCGTQDPAAFGRDKNRPGGVANTCRACKRRQDAAERARNCPRTGYRSEPLLRCPVCGGERVHVSIACGDTLARWRQRCACGDEMSVTLHPEPERLAVVRRWMGARA